MHLRDGQTIFGALEDGELARDFGSEMTDLVKALTEHCEGRRKATAKGKITITIDVKVDGDGTVELESDLATKKPKKLRRGGGVYWAGEDGALLTEHPQQVRMNFGERARAAVDA